MIFFYAFLYHCRKGESLAIKGRKGIFSEFVHIKKLYINALPLKKGNTTKNSGIYLVSLDIALNGKR